MTINPQMLGIFNQIYGSADAMTISKALLVALVGFCTVVIILAVIALFIKFIAYIFSFITKKKVASAPAPAAPVKHAPAVNAPAAAAMRGQVKLIDVDEPTAAVIMALVSHNSGIPLEKLDFKSIKPLEDK